MSKSPRRKPYRLLLTSPGCLVIGGLLLLGFLSLAWYLGMVPVANGPARARIRHALHLNILPSSLTVNASGSVSWIDYFFEADVTIDPKDFDKLLRGRAYKNVRLSAYDETTKAARIEGYQGFAANERWEWIPSPDVSCVLHVSQDRGRIFIRFSSE